MRSVIPDKHTLLKVRVVSQGGVPRFCVVSLRGPRGRVVHTTTSVDVDAAGGFRLEYPPGATRGQPRTLPKLPEGYNRRVLNRLVSLPDPGTAFSSVFVSRGEEPALEVSAIVLGLEIPALAPGVGSQSVGFGMPDAKGLALAALAAQAKKLGYQVEQLGPLLRVGTPGGGPPPALTAPSWLDVWTVPPEWTITARA